MTKSDIASRNSKFANAALAVLVSISMVFGVCVPAQAWAVEETNELAVSDKPAVGTDNASEDQVSSENANGDKPADNNGVSEEGENAGTDGGDNANGGASDVEEPSEGDAKEEAVPVAPFEGDGTSTSPFLIDSAYALTELQDVVNNDGTYTDSEGKEHKYSDSGVCYKLTTDITLSKSTNWDPIKNWIPIGAGVFGKSFKGTFDGDGHKISGLIISSAPTEGATSNKPATEPSESNKDEEGKTPSESDAVDEKAPEQSTEDETPSQSEGTDQGDQQPSTEPTLADDQKESGENGEPDQNVETMPEAESSDEGNVPAEPEGSEPNSEKNPAANSSNVDTSTENNGADALKAPVLNRLMRELTVLADSESTENPLGLFGTTDGATISDLTLNAPSIDVDTATYVGALVGLATNGTIIKNVMVEGGSVSGYGCVGGIVGCMSGATSGTISGCENSATVTGSDSTVGGIVGLAAGIVSSCTDSAAVVGSGSGIGGIVGELQSAGSVSGCTNEASVTNKAKVVSGNTDNVGTGGIVGLVRYDGASGDYPTKKAVNITNNENIGAVAGANDGGGIVGAVYNYAVVTDNTNAAPIITGTTYAAGLVGSYQVSKDSAITPAPTAPNLKVTDNYMLTVVEKITANNTDLFVNVDEGVSSASDDVLVEDNQLRMVEDVVVEVVTPEGEDASITDEQSLAYAKEVAKIAVDKICEGEAPYGIAEEEAVDIEALVKGIDVKAIDATLSFGAKSLTGLPVADAKLVQSVMTETEAAIAAYDLTVDLKVAVSDSVSRNKADEGKASGTAGLDANADETLDSTADQNKADDSTGTTKDASTTDENAATASITELDKPVVFNIKADPAKVSSANALRVVFAHAGTLNAAQLISTDKTTGMLAIDAQQFSTYTVLADYPTPDVAAANAMGQAGDNMPIVLLLLAAAGVLSFFAIRRFAIKSED